MWALLNMNFKLEQSFSIFVYAPNNKVTITLLLTLNVQTNGKFFCK